MGEFILCILEPVFDALLEEGLSRFCGRLLRTVPMRIRYGAYWRSHARRQIVARRIAMKGMA